MEGTPYQLMTADREADMKPTSTGYIPFRTYQTWYMVFGDLNNRTRRPLVGVHGGPGIPHHVLIHIGNLFSTHGIPVILYDQIGCGRSTHLDHEGPEFWIVGLFLEELDNLLSKLGIGEDYDLLGHSWGGMLIAEHAVRQPQGLKHLILANAPATKASFIEAQAKLRAQLPADIQAKLDKHEREGTTETPEGRETLGLFFARHLCRIQPMPIPEDREAEPCQREINRTVRMQYTADLSAHLRSGVKRWENDGNQKDWTIIERLPCIRAATLVINGKYDICTDEVVRPYVERIPDAKWVTLQESSHMPQLEEMGKYLEVVAGFLSDKIIRG